MSDTPRTDAIFDNLHYGGYQDGSGDGVTAQEASFAALLNLCRTLERELSQAKKTPDFLSQALNEGDGVYRP